MCTHLLTDITDFLSSLWWRTVHWSVYSFILVLPSICPLKLLMEATFSTRGRFNTLSHSCALYPQFKASHLKHFYIYYVGPRSTRFPLLTWKLSSLHWWGCLRSEEQGNSSFMSKITRKMTQVLTRGWTLQKWPVKNLSRGYPSLLLPFSFSFSSKNSRQWHAWIVYNKMASLKTWCFENNLCLEFWFLG